MRKNVAQVHGQRATESEQRDRWATGFGYAKEGRAPGVTDIVPFWVFSEGDARIERHVPSLPMSRDQERAAKLRSSLAVYRMAFGQPRQEDLVAYLVEKVPAYELAGVMAEMRIELGPEARTAIASK